MKKAIPIILALILIIAIPFAFAGGGSCTKCSCAKWVQKSPYSGKAGEPHAYCKCGHFWNSHR